MIIVALDQMIKVDVKTSFALHEGRKITSWMYIYFIENGGMAFGADFLGTTILSIARVLFIGLLITYLIMIRDRKVAVGYFVCLALIIAGAIGNIIDNALYGLIFTDSTDTSIASLVPIGQGYAGFMEGKVVDMFYFPLVDTFLPYGWPLIGGTHVLFFAPVFNLADASITAGAIACLLFYRKYMLPPKKLARI